MSEGHGPTVLRLVATADAPAEPGVCTVVVDTTWTPRLGDDRVGLRDLADRVLRAHDLNAEATSLLETWVLESGIVDLTTVDGTSFWFYRRLAHWIWLQERLLWSRILEVLSATGAWRRIECATEVDAGLREAAAAMAVSRGLEFEVTKPVAGVSTAATSPGPSVSDPPPGVGSRAPGGKAGLARRVLRRLRPDPRRQIERQILARVSRLEQEEGRLLVVLQHATQRVDTATGPRMMNVYLDPIVDRLRGTPLDPIGFETTAGSDSPRDDPGGWEDRILPGAVLRVLGQPTDAREAQADAIADRVALLDVPLVIAGVDVGPALTERVAAQLRHDLASKLRSMVRIRRLLRRLRPAAILLADEYHRQEWLGAAALEGVPVVAVQHGIIHRWHPGYIFASRPPGLRLPDRLYVFGRWERRLLLDSSVFEPDMVRVGGSPRIDLLDRGAIAPADTVRADLGVAPSDRMVVISGTWGAMGRRIRMPIALASIVDRPLSDVHLVIKLHPGEKDEGPYRQVIESAATARGFVPPPMTLIHSADLYRLLGAADAHLGVQSTVLTEAVVTGTRNLIAASDADDVLGWVEAGVALRVNDGAGLLAALDDPGTVPAEPARRAFLADHFEPGDASERIAAELLEWLVAVPPRS